MQATTTQRPATLAERVLEGKRRELAELQSIQVLYPQMARQGDYQRIGELQADIAWMERHLAERAVTHG